MNNNKDGGAPAPETKVPLTEGTLKASKLDNANIFSRLAVYWVSPLISLAYKRRLEMPDVEDVPKDMKSEDLGYQLEKHWNGKFFSTMRRVFGKDFIWIVIPFIVLTASSTTTPFLIQMFLRYMSTPNDQETGLSGWAIVGIIAAIGIVQAFAINTGFLLSSILAVKVRSAVANLIFRKAIKLSSASRASLSAGDVLNLMSQDTERLFFAVLLGHTIWWAALMMLIVAVVLLIEIGIAGLAAVLFAALLMPFTSHVASRIGLQKRKMLRFTDERVSLSSEMLQGIQTVKMQNWEEFIKSKVFTMRENEMIHGKKVMQYLALNAWQVFSVPPLMAAMCFGVLAATNPNQLNVATIYSVLAFLNTLALPLDLIPRAAGTFTQALVSVNRIERFMALKDVAGASSESPLVGNIVADELTLGSPPGSASSFLVPKLSPEDVNKESSDMGNAESSDTILSIRGCTFFWTRRKDDETFNKSKASQGRRKLKRGQSVKVAMKRFTSSARNLRQQSFQYAASFRGGYLFQPPADADDPALGEDGPNPTSKMNKGVHPQIELEEVDVLMDVNLDIRRGELIVVVGEVGSGKSSLLQAVLGEIGLREGGQLQWFTKNHESPSIAYVPQEPWIQNSSLKDNILFVRSRPTDEELYQETIRAVQMLPDLATLPKGDKTEIGSRGINLSKSSTLGNVAVM